MKAVSMISLIAFASLVVVSSASGPMRCHREIARFCSQESDVDSRYICVGANEHKLSPPCREMVDRTMPCLKDLTNKGVCAPAEGQKHDWHTIGQCLMNNKDKIQPQCVMAIKFSPWNRCAEFFNEPNCPNSTTFGEDLACVVKSHTEEAIQCQRSVGNWGRYVRQMRFLLDGPRLDIRKTRKACLGDVQEFCGHVDEHMAGVCLQEHSKDISKNCYDAVHERAMFQCGESIRRFCPKSRFGRELADCMMSKFRELDENCQNQFEDDGSGFSPLEKSLRPELDDDDEFGDCAFNRRRHHRFRRHLWFSIFIGSVVFVVAGIALFRRRRRAEPESEGLRSGVTYRPFV